MIIEVEMLAFGNPGEVRPVEIPNQDVSLPVNELLEVVFYWGQNDFQPQQHPSVSAGDVVRIGDDRYLCRGVGWKKLEQAEYENISTAKARGDVDAWLQTITNRERPTKKEVSAD
jgi:hypothetical protein